MPDLQTTRYAWVYGPSGSGKTSFAFTDVDRSEVYVKSLRDDFWTDYAQDLHTRVLVDDIDGAPASVMAAKLLKWSEGSSCYAHRTCEPDFSVQPFNLVVTSYQSIEDYFSGHPAVSQTLQHRFTEFNLGAGNQ